MNLFEIAGLTIFILIVLTPIALAINWLIDKIKKR